MVKIPLILASRNPFTGFPCGSASKETACNAEDLFTFTPFTLQGDTAVRMTVSKMQIWSGHFLLIIFMIMTKFLYGLVWLVWLLSTSLASSQMRLFLTFGTINTMTSFQASSHHKPLHTVISSYPAFWLRLSIVQGLPRWHSGEESTCQCRRHKGSRFHPWIW